jgi:hypothetical protein
MSGTTPTFIGFDETVTTYGDPASGRTYAPLPAAGCDLILGVSVDMDTGDMAPVIAVPPRQAPPNRAQRRAQPTTDA